MDTCFSGIETTCQMLAQSHPRPKGTCQEKCVCREGHVRSENGTCLSVDQMCSCPENEHYEYNGYPACAQTCDTLVQYCDTNQHTASPGCYCNEGYARNENGACIPVFQCPEYECPYGEEFNECGSLCPPNCIHPEQEECSAECSPGCFCIENYLRAPNGVCVPKEICYLTINEIDEEFYYYDTDEHDE